MEILNEFTMPVITRVGNRGSKYLTNEQFAEVKRLLLKQAVILPFVAGATEAHQRKTVSDRLAIELKAEGDAMKLHKFAVGIVPQKGIAIQRIDDVVPAADAAPAVEVAK